MKCLLRLWLFFGLFVVLACQQTAAEQLKGLYTETLQVASQSQRERNRAASKALKMVFTRISGHASVLDNTRINQAARKPEAYLKQYSYQRNKREGSQAELAVVLEFDRSLIDGLLRAEGLPIWADNRPIVLVWIVKEDAQGREFVGRATSPELVKVIKEQARLRGVSVKIPFLDLEDTMAMSPNALWQLNLWTAERAAQRYNADSLLIAKASQLTNGQWLGEWVFTTQGKRWRIDGPMAERDDYVRLGIDFVADQLASLHAIVPVTIAKGGILIRLTGIKDFTDYIRAIHYLEQLAAVRHASPIMIDDNTMLVRLLADGQLEQLQQAIALDNRLQPANPVSGGSKVALHYNWPVSN